MNAAGVSLIVASLDLQLVKLLRSAMAGGGAGTPAATSPAARFEPRRVIEPEPRLQPRRVFQPTPRFEPRPVLPETPRLANAPCEPCEPAKSPPAPSPFPPPWQQPLPWPEPGPAPRVVKVLSRPPDIRHKGTLIDTFI